jgi:hypothetical protein
MLLIEQTSVATVANLCRKLPPALGQFIDAVVNLRVFRSNPITIVTIQSRTAPTRTPCRLVSKGFLNGPDRLSTQL